MRILVAVATGLATIGVVPASANAARRCDLSAALTRNASLNGVNMRADATCKRKARRTFETKLVTERQSGETDVVPFSGSSGGAGRQYKLRDVVSCTGWNWGPDDDPPVRLGLRVSLHGPGGGSKRSRMVSFAALCPNGTESS